jgi:hypothetical protein
VLYGFIYNYELGLLRQKEAISVASGAGSSDRLSVKTSARVEKYDGKSLTAVYETKDSNTVHGANAVKAADGNKKQKA